jgi:hypothetical protein
MFVLRHSTEKGSAETEMVPDGPPDWFGTAIAQDWTRAGGVGAKIERSHESGERALKPLPQFSVYISAETKTR